MAEAVTAVPTRFFCHLCNVEISNTNADFTCPHCMGGFVEELPANAPPARRNNVNRLNSMEGLGALPGELANFFMARNGGNFEISIEPGRRSGNNSSSNINLGGGRVRPQSLDRLDNVLFDFLSTMSNEEQNAGNQPMFIMGNFGDYAWGREGIDRIVTQLLNQMETSGPPPLSKTKIDKIPKVEVTIEDIENKPQCSVCWEDFNLKEIVRKLPCSHIYHENCIVPWLGLHGTCPICRKSLIDESEVANDDDVANTQTIIDNSSNSVDTNETINNGPSTSNARNSTSQNQNQRNNVFAFDNSNLDLD